MAAEKITRGYEVFTALQNRSFAYSIYASEMLSTKGYQIENEGIGNERYYTSPLTTPEQAEIVKHLLMSQYSIPSPSHLFVMSPKGASTHIVHNRNSNNPIGVAVGYLSLSDNDYGVKITHSVGNDIVRSIAEDAVTVDALNRGLSVVNLENPIDISGALTTQRERTSGLANSSLLGLERMGNRRYTTQLKDGRIIQIKPPTPDDYASIEQIELDAWEQNDGDPDGNIVVRETDLTKLNGPDNTMMVAEVDGKVVSFVFGFPGINGKGKPVLYSHMAATHPDYQSVGVMQALKKAQLVEAARLGLEEVRWTYDPAYSMTEANNPVNLNSLGCVVDKYIVSPYSKNIQQGRYAELDVVKQRPTDRFEVVQHLTDPGFINHITGNRKKSILGIQDARQLEMANPNSEGSLLKYPLRHPNDSATNYILTMREQIGPLLNEGRYIIEHVASDYNKLTRTVSEAYFVLRSVYD